MNKHLTWLYKLHIDNHEDLYKLWRQRTRFALDRYGEGIDTINLLMDNLKSDLENNTPSITVSQKLLGFEDMIGYMLTQIDYHQIALELIEDHRE